MIGLIPFVQNDYLLTLFYILIILVSFFVEREKHDLKVFIFGFLIMIISETFFINTGVEVFVRQSLFGTMPLWLPFLWGYGFVAISRSVKIISNQK
jgi:hypothetical protein